MYVMSKGGGGKAEEEEEEEWLNNMGRTRK